MESDVTGKVTRKYRIVLAVVLTLGLTLYVAFAFAMKSVAEAQYAIKIEQDYLPNRRHDTGQWPDSLDGIEDYMRLHGYGYDYLKMTRDARPSIIVTYQDREEMRGEIVFSWRWLPQGRLPFVSRRDYY